ncbi:hypothetical protein B0H13DRAFT_2340421 [Mycena leptocephala]|nr:hypothetical protein B0H13DRAFT_2340421 [Mycena leptocephala]
MLTYDYVGPARCAASHLGFTVLPGFFAGAAALAQPSLRVPSPECGEAGCKAGCEAYPVALPWAPRLHGNCTGCGFPVPQPPAPGSVLLRHRASAGLHRKKSTSGVDSGRRECALCFHTLKRVLPAVAAHTARTPPHTVAVHMQWKGQDTE